MALVRPLSVICGQAPEAPFWSLTGEGRVVSGAYYNMSGFIHVTVGDTVIQGQLGEEPLALSCTAALVVKGMLGPVPIGNAIARYRDRLRNHGCR